MRFWILTLLIIVLVGSASCAYKRLDDVEQSVDKFHSQLNQQQYHEIYAESDPELHSRITEAEFTAQLLHAHDQLGTVTGTASVLSKDSLWRNLKRRFNGGREHVTHGNMAEGDEIFANEEFVWAIGAGQPRLVSYALGGVTCRKPCRLGFGYGPP